MLFTYLWMRRAMRYGGCGRSSFWTHWYVGRMNTKPPCSLESNNWFMCAEAKDSSVTVDPEHRRWEYRYVVCTSHSNTVFQKFERKILLHHKLKINNFNLSESQKFQENFAVNTINGFKHSNTHEFFLKRKKERKKNRISWFVLYFGGGHAHL